MPNERDQSVSMVSTGTLSETKNPPGARGMYGANTGMFERVAVVLSREESKALIVDLDEGRHVAEIALPSLAETGVTADAGRKVYAALSGSDKVAVIDPMRFKTGQDDRRRRPPAMGRVDGGRTQLLSLTSAPGPLLAVLRLEVQPSVKSTCAGQA